MSLKMANLANLEQLTRDVFLLLKLGILVF